MNRRPQCAPRFRPPACGRLAARPSCLREVAQSGCRRKSGVSHNVIKSLPSVPDARPAETSDSKDQPPGINGWWLVAALLGLLLLLLWMNPPTPP